MTENSMNLILRVTSKITKGGPYMHGFYKLIITDFLVNDLSTTSKVWV